MARTKDVVLAPEQKELMEKEYAQEHSSFFEEVENSDLEVVTENVAATNT